MNTVGVSHYLRMLKNAVDDLRSGNKEETETSDQPVEIQLPIEAFIPSFYITESEEKISVYQKLAGSEDETILGEFEQDLRDEYGEPPAQVLNLFSILRLKMACRRGGVVRVKAEDSGRKELEIVLSLAPFVTAKEIMQLLTVNSQWKISGSTLRINQSALSVKNKDWVTELRTEIEALAKKKEKKAEKVEA
jgi:transcription-repair coupling factor (superfamily II helicase)